MFRNSVFFFLVIRCCSVVLNGTFSDYLVKCRFTFRTTLAWNGDFLDSTREPVGMLFKQVVLDTMEQCFCMQNEFGMLPRWWLPKSFATTRWLVEAVPRNKNIYVWQNDVMDQCYDWSPVMAALPLCSFWCCHSLYPTADSSKLTARCWFCRRSTLNQWLISKYLHRTWL